jgi:hypothetical protein
MGARYYGLHYIDVRITDVDAKSNRSKDPAKVLAAHERQMKKKYVGACLEQRSRHFFTVRGIY